MGEEGLKIMENFGSFVGFQGTNYGIKWGVLFKHLPLALGGTDCGRRIKIYLRHFTLKSTTHALALKPKPLVVRSTDHGREPGLL